ncbi:hypothetical protein F2981_17935 [Sinorhizobium meliloti]|nr:hypothetical protein [Sinorhizobium meliloti]
MTSDAVFGLEAGDHVAVPAPIVRERDCRQRAFLLGGCDELFARLGNGYCRRCEQHGGRKREQDVESLKSLAFSLLGFQSISPMQLKICDEAYVTGFVPPAADMSASEQSPRLHSNVA